jgi:hypothetical protein
VQIQRKVVSAEPGIAPHSAGSSVHNLAILLNHILKSQVTQYTCNEDTKKSVDLRDIPLPEWKVRSLLLRLLTRCDCVTLRDKSFATPQILGWALRLSSETFTSHSLQILAL